MRILRMVRATRFQRVPWLEAKAISHQPEGVQTCRIAAEWWKNAD